MQTGWMCGFRLLLALVQLLAGPFEAADANLLLPLLVLSLRLAAPAMS
jgi:hypothetical protein